MARSGLAPAAHRLVQELKQRFEKDLNAAFGSLDPATWLALFIPNTDVTFNLRLTKEIGGAAAEPKTIKLYTGGMCSYLAKCKMCTGAVPGPAVASTMFGKLKKAGYERSTIKVKKYKSVSKTEAMVACAVQRFKAGEKKPYEEFAALYSAVNIDGKWMIRDMWAFDDMAKPPTSVPLADFKKC